MVSGKESGFGEGVRLFADPRIPYLYSRFIVRETGFSESWSQLFSLERPIHPSPFLIGGYVLRGIRIDNSTSPDSSFIDQVSGGKVAPTIVPAPWFLHGDGWRCKSVTGL